MKIYKTQQEAEKDIKDGVLAIDGDVKFECDISIDANITAENINAMNINAWDINAENINARNINARNINAWDINAENINARNINARNINAWDINAENINAWNIDAWNISYWAICMSYNSIKCKSIEGRRDNHQEPICLDGELIIKEDKSEQKEVIELNGKKYKLIED